MTPLAKARRVVVKIGSSLLTNAGAGLDRGAVAGLLDPEHAHRMASLLLVLFMGAGQVIEIWNPARYQEYMKPDDLDYDFGTGRLPGFLAELVS